MRGSAHPADGVEAIVDGLGRFGVFRRSTLTTPELAVTLERLGYATLWLGAADGDLRLAEELLDATSSLTVATGIVNIWRDDAKSVAAAYHRVAARHPERFLLGIGVGHPESIGDRYAKPYSALVTYLDVLDAEQVPRARRVLAALGPKVVRLSGDRAAGAHPYLVTPEHTRRAREILGSGPLLVPEQKVVLDTDPVRARAIGRPAVESPYLGLINYTNNLRTLGFDDTDLAGGGSDRLIDALVVHGDPATVADGLARHVDAGADQVAINLVTSPGEDPVPGYAALAETLFG
jgi:probable F420-dependent oxidoreductase